MYTSNDVQLLLDYTAHDPNCILNFYCAGRPTENGYEEKFADKWYSTRPIDNTPKCECGLDELLEKFNA